MTRTVFALIAASILLAATAVASPEPAGLTERDVSAADLSLPGEWDQPAEVLLAIRPIAPSPQKDDGPILHPALLSLPGEIVDDLLAPAALQAKDPIDFSCESK